MSCLQEVNHFKFDLCLAGGEIKNENKFLNLHPEYFL